MPIPPFTGTLSETWESFPASHGEPIQLLPDPTTIMGGSASISHPEMVVFDTSAPGGLGTSGPAQPADGQKAMAALGRTNILSIEFFNPLTRFGAYWGAPTADQDPYFGDPTHITVNFFDTTNLLIGTEVFSYTRSQIGDGLLEWHGWSSTVSIKRLSYSQDLVVIDGLEADPIPEPAALLPLTLVALWAMTRRARV